TQSPNYTPDAPPRFHNLQPAGEAPAPPLLPTPPAEPQAMSPQDATSLQEWRPQGRRTASIPPTGSVDDVGQRPRDSDTMARQRGDVHSARKPVADASLAMPAPVVVGTDGTIA